MTSSPQSDIGHAAFVDLETTGFDSESNEIIELAIAVISFDRQTGKMLKVVDKYSGLREPSRSIPRQSTKIHGLTKNDVAGRSLDNTAIARALFKADLVVAHNARFDYPFAVKYMPEFKQLPWHCSLEQINWPLIGATGRKLEYLLELHGIAVDRHHRALDDVKALVNLLRKEHNGQPYFWHLLQAGPMPESVLTKEAKMIKQYELDTDQADKTKDTQQKVEETGKKVQRLGCMLTGLITLPLFGVVLGGPFGLVIGLLVGGLIFWAVLKKGNQK